MTRVEKLLANLLSVPNTFDFNDFARVMQYLGYELDQKGRTSGSRVRFYRESDGRILVMHSPHPSNEMTRGAVKAAVRFLRGEELP